MRKIIISLILILCFVFAAAALFFVNLSDDVRNSGKGFLKSGTDTVLSISIRFADQDRAKRPPLPEFSWNDLFLQRGFKKSLPQLFKENGLPQKRILLSANYSGFSMIPGFKADTFYIHWQYKNSDFKNAEQILQKIAVAYCDQLKTKKIAAQPYGTAIMRNPDLRSLWTILAIEKTIAAAALLLLLLALTVLAVSTENWKKPFFKNIACYPFIAALSIPLILIISKNTLFSLLLFALTLFGTITILYFRQKKLKPIFMSVVLFLLFGIAGLFFIRAEQYLEKPQYIQKFNEDMLFHQKIKISDQIKTNQVWQYGAYDLPATTFFRTRLMLQESPKLKKRELALALSRYPFFCSILRGRGELFSQGSTHFAMRLTKARFFKTEGPNSKTHNKNMMTHLKKLHAYFITEYRKFIAREGLYIEALGPVQIIYPYPPLDKTPLTRAIICWVLCVLLATLLLLRKNASLQKKLLT